MPSHVGTAPSNHQATFWSMYLWSMKCGGEREFMIIAGGAQRTPKQVIVCEGSECLARQPERPVGQ